MTLEDAPLTERQQQLMAYIDEELAPADRARFERAMANDADLAREVVQHQNLMALSQSLQLAEPTDHEVRRFWARFYNRTEWQLGWVLFAVGALALLGEGLYLLIASSWLSTTQKIALVSTVAGGLLLLWNTLRLKLRTSHFDRYRGVTR